MNHHELRNKEMLYILRTLIICVCVGRYEYRMLSLIPGQWIEAEYYYVFFAAEAKQNVIYKWRRRKKNRMYIYSFIPVRSRLHLHTHKRSIAAMQRCTSLFISHAPCLQHHRVVLLNDLKKKKEKGGDILYGWRLEIDKMP